MRIFYKNSRNSFIRSKENISVQNKQISSCLRWFYSETKTFNDQWKTNKIVSNKK